LTLTLTDEQEACIAATRGSSQSLLINALAGAAKTTTLCYIAQALPVAPTLCLAFNKRIAEEMGKRMPSFVTCQTMNSLGHQTWGRSLGKRLVLETDKSYKIVQDVTQRLRSKDRELFGQLLKALRICKSAGYVPSEMRKLGQSLCEIEDLLDTFAQQIDIDPDAEFLHTVDICLTEGIVSAYNGLIDFDDQIYMSTLFGGTFTKYPVVMIDEAQDLSPLNHEMLRRLKSDRIIAVGDPHQAIYAFRGASHTSMSELKDQFQMLELSLSTSFRCPIAVVQNAHWWVPHMRYPAWAKEGEVVHLTEWGPSLIPDGAAIICRNNAPLFSIAMKLIRHGRGIKILGNDVGAGLLKILEKLGPGDTLVPAGLDAIDRWEAAETRKAHKARLASIRDRAECLRVFVSQTSSLDEAKAYAKTIFAASGPIQLMTGHKSKGGEWPVVFHLDPFLVPSKWALRQAAETGDESQLIQERNLKYVIETRAQETLYFVNSEDFQ
jgi:DNA helicase II / ATP-dependent DNA helicase PcrA